MNNSASRSLVSLVVLALACNWVCAQDQSGSFGLTNIPGVQTTNGILASATDGMARYLANDGPIQPAITAIGGLPMRGAELLNRGIGSVSSGLSSGARAFNSNSGSVDGAIRVPGMQALASVMPSPVASLASMMGSGIQMKNQFIASQGQRGVDSANRLGTMMRGALPTGQ